MTKLILEYRMMVKKLIEAILKRLRIRLRRVVLVCFGVLANVDRESYLD
jgi:hypothetical protein